MEITGDSMELVFRDNNIVIILPDANIRRSGRVVVKTGGGKFMAKVLLRKSVRKVDLESLNRAHNNRIVSI